MKKNLYPGSFIVIEGLDGSGKTSQVKLLFDFLTKKRRVAILTKEPTRDSKASEKINLFLKGDLSLDPLEVQKLFARDRKEHLEKKVIPALKEGKIVVSSRYFFSSFAYGVSEGLKLEQLVELNKEFLIPDLTIIIDVLPEHCLERIEQRGGSKKYFENLEKLKKARDFYKKFPELFENVFIVKGEQTMSKVFEKIKKLVNKIL